MDKYGITFLINILHIEDTQYLGQVATVFGWDEKEKTEETAEGTCRPRKLGLPVLSHRECLGAAADGQYVSEDKGCVGVIGSISPICHVSGIYRIIVTLQDIFRIMYFYQNKLTGYDRNPIV